jgi:nitrite reductase/ring-hydroxylating ferredoxin subunit
VEAMYEEPGGVLVCPAHGLKFDKSTGRVLDESCDNAGGIRSIDGVAHRHTGAR